MAKGYVIARATVTDPEKWAAYAKAASAVMASFGGQPIVRGGRWELAEGSARARNAVLEFPCFDAARGYATSQEYAEARALRAGAGVIDIVVVEGSD
ncbi:MAG: DUF1330 domain-containing protein [Pseudomonadota bacterium]